MGMCFGMSYTQNPSSNIGWRIFMADCRNGGSIKYLDWPEGRNYNADQWYHVAVTCQQNSDPNINYQCHYYIDNDLKQDEFASNSAGLNPMGYPSDAGWGLYPDSNTV